MRDDRANLGSAINTDNSVRSAVRDHIAQLGAPFVIGDLWRPLGIRRENVQRELTRMIKKGLLVQRKVRGRVQSGRGPNGHMLNVWLYSVPEGYDYSEGDE